MSSLVKTSSISSMSISNLYAPPVSILVRSRPPLRPRRDHALASSPLPLPCGPHSAPILIHMPHVGRCSARWSSLNHGYFLDPGSLRTSTMDVTPAALIISTKSSNSRLEWPTVKMRMSPMLRAKRVHPHRRPGIVHRQVVGPVERGVAGRTFNAFAPAFARHQSYLRPSVSHGPFG